MGSVFEGDQSGPFLPIYLSQIRPTFLAGENGTLGQKGTRQGL